MIFLPNQRVAAKKIACYISNPWLRQVTHGAAGNNLIRTVDGNLMSTHIRRIEPGARMSQAVVANGMVWLAGQVAPDPSADVEGQTRQILGEIDRLLAAAGSGKERIASATIYLADVAGFAAMNRAWEAWVPADAKPARATVEARLVAPEYKVEIQVTALA